MAEKELLSIEGVVSSVVFHSEETGFTVLELETQEETLTVVGEILGLSEGEEIRATGSFGSHPSYGRQFRAEAFERILPATASAILRYLSGGAVKGIGPVLAKRIVDRFGDRSLEVMDRDPHALSQVRGVSPQKAMEIAEEYRRIVGIRSVMMFLSSHGVAPSASIAVWKKWGGLSQEVITADPYCLCDPEIGLGFAQADDIAANLGFEQDAPCRVRGGILHVLRHNLGNGHSCLPVDKLLPTVASLLEISGGEAEKALDELRENGDLTEEAIDGGRFCYLPDQYRAESYVGDRLSMMIGLSPGDRPVEEEEIAALERELGISYAKRQKKAIASAVDQNILILTGGPGTGKTTTLNGIITLLERRGMKVALAAPTGRAAKRLSEVTGREAKTVHRLLEVDFGEENGMPKFKRNERNPLACDAVVVDEMSMVDILLFSCLLKAVRPGCRMILVGDPDQLPSVGAGNVLKDMIDSGAVECVHLDQVFRQAAQSLIVVGAHQIVSGETPPLGVKDSDLFFLPRASPEETAKTVADLCARRLPKAYGLSPTADIQVISPTKAGGAGTVELNRLLQEALNPPVPGKSEYKTNVNLFREGDKVMQIRNNYDIVWAKDDGDEGMGVFNGDIGVIDLIDKPSRSMLIRFEDRTAQYDFDMLSEIDLAYAVTVHKSQGNEFDAVVLPLVGRHRRLHYRNLLYTAVTRAKKLLVIVGQVSTVEAMVENNRKTLRYTNLCARLKEALC